MAEQELAALMIMGLVASAVGKLLNTLTPERIRTDGVVLTNFIAVAILLGAHVLKGFDVPGVSLEAEILVVIGFASGTQWMSDKGHTALVKAGRVPGRREPDPPVIPAPMPDEKP